MDKNLDKIIPVPTLVAIAGILVVVMIAVMLVSVADKIPDKKKSSPQKETAKIELVDIPSNNLTDQPKFIYGDKIDVVGGFYKGSWGHVTGIFTLNEDTSFILER